VLYIHLKITRFESRNRKREEIAMILVADSGSSSSDWMLNVPDSKPLKFKTKGLNPFFVNEKEIERVMKEVP
jgi:hypothetical protein